MTDIECKCGCKDVKYIGSYITEKIQKAIRRGDIYTMLDLYDCNNCHTTITGDKYKVEIKRVD